MPHTVHVVAAVLRNAASQVLIQQRPPGKHLAGFWEFPGGKTDPGESSWDALVRELREELDVTVTAGEPLICLHHDYPDRTIKLDVWQIHRWHGTVRALEQQQIKWLAAGELARQQLLPADGPVVAALHLPTVHLITPDIEGPVVAFLDRLEAAVCRHQLKLVTLRQTACDDRAYHALARAAVNRLKAHECSLLLHGNPRVRMRWTADLDAAGFHLRAADAAGLAQRPDCRGWMAMSCHDAAQLRRAADLGADFAVLGSVNPTRSHPEARPMGWERFAQLVEKANVPVYAIGGMRVDDVSRSRAAGAQGVAAITALWET